MQWMALEKFLETRPRPQAALAPTIAHVFPNVLSSPDRLDNGEAKVVAHATRGDRSADPLGREITSSMQLDDGTPRHQRSGG